MKNTHVAVRALSKELENQYTQDEIDRLEWHVDTETDDTYSWHFVFPDDRRKRTMTYVSSTKSVVTKLVTSV